MSERLQAKRYRNRAWLLLYAMLFLAPPLVAQFASVVDGYDNQTVALSPQLSFAPHHEGTPKLHYLSRRHLREVRLGQNIIAKTFAHATTSNVLFLRWKYPGLNSALPVVADQVFDRTPMIELRAYDGEQWRRVLSPPFGTYYFDFLLPNPNDLSNVEWAFLQGDYLNQRLIIMHATQRGNAFALDTLGFLPAFVSAFDPNHAMILLRHGDAAKSIAITTGRTLNVFFDNGASWQQYHLNTNTQGYGDVYGGTLAEGTPFWLMRYYFVQLLGNQLVADSLDFLPTTGTLICRALHQDERGRIHAVYVVNVNHESSYYYVQRNEGVWLMEKIPLPSSYFAFALATQRDTVLLAYSGFGGEVNLAQRSAPAAWKMSLLDRAGDVGNDVTAAFDDSEGRIALAYYDRTNGDLKIAHGVSSFRYYYAHNWFALRVDSVGNVGRLPAALWANDTLHAVYLDDTRGLLQHGRQIKQSDSTFSAWQVESIDSVSVAQTRHQLLRSEEGVLRVAYSSTGEIRIATRSQGDWQIQRFSSSEQPDAPGEINLFFHPEGLKLGYVRAERLRVGTQAGGIGEWTFANIPSLKPAVYAVWTTDAIGRLHVVYRARDGFHDEIRHVAESGGSWAEQVITTTITNDMRLRLQSVEAYRMLVLALVDDGLVKLHCYTGGRWMQFLQSAQLASEAGFDFLSAVYGSTYMFYRNPVPGGNPFQPAFSADLISEFGPGVVEAVEQREVAESARAELSVFPNPFNAATRIRFSITSETSSTLVIHNVLGQVVRKYSFNQAHDAAQTIIWDGKDNFNNAAPSGVYVVRLNAGARSLSQKIVLLR